MFKLHKPHLSSSSSTAIHSGHFMVSRVDDDEDDNNDAGDDSSESERDNGQSFEIDVSNPDSVADAAKISDISYQVESPSAKNELVTSWNDLDRPIKRPHKHHHYLTYYTNSSSCNLKADSRRKVRATGANGIGGAGGTGTEGGGATSPGSSGLAGAASQLAATASATTTATAPSSSLASGGAPILADDHSMTPVDATIDGGHRGRHAAHRHNNPQLRNHHHHHQALANESSARSPNCTPNSAITVVSSGSNGQYTITSTANHNNTSSNLNPSDLSQTTQAARSAGSVGAAAASAPLNGGYPHLDDCLDEPRDLSSDSQNQLQLIAQPTEDQMNELDEVGQEEDPNADSQQRHAITIDPSLTKLLESMSLYYSHKLTSPKWKSFKGLKLRMKHKIRLNNLIWRAWFFQCIRGRAAPGCQFTAPPESDVHKKDESIVLEGKYWKRKEKAIVDEYKKWRTFHKQKSQIASGQMQCFRPTSFDWDSRVSNWASSSMYGGEYGLYDYDINTDYHLDELTPMPEQLEQESYYQPAIQIQSNSHQTPSMNTRMIESPQQQQQQQQQQIPAMSPTALQASQPQQLITQVQVPSRVHENPHQHHNQLHQQQQQQIQNHAHLQQHNQQQQHHHHHHQALSLKATRSPVSTMAIQQNADQMQQQQQQQQNLATTSQPININLSSFSQLPPHQHLHQQHQIHAQLHQQQHQHTSNQSPLAVINQQQRQLNQPVHHHHNHHNQQHQLQQQQQQQQQSVPYAFENNAVYQQIQHQQQQQHQLQHQPQQFNLSQAQQVQQQQQQDQQSFLNQDLCSISSGASGSGSIISGMGGGRNEQRRVGHINAEQKRRSNIKNGFDTLRSILPTINHNVNIKVSKASMLQKAAHYISTLTDEQRKQLDEQARLRQQVDALKQTILMHQSQLPSSGCALPGSGVNSTTSSRAREMLQEYIRKKTADNWKFWIFSLVIEPMYESYYKTVNTNSLEEAFKTIYSWLDQNCGLGSMRKDVTQSLTALSTNTNVLFTPQTLPTEAMEAVRYQSHPHTHSHPNQHHHHQQQQASSNNSNNLSSQLVVMPPTPAPSAASLQSNLSIVTTAGNSTTAATTTATAQTPTPPIATLTSRVTQHQHQQLQQFQMSQQVQPATQPIQNQPIRSMW